MSLLGNVLWLLFGGLVAGIGYLLGGVALCLTLVGIPFGLQAFKLGIATFAPFGKVVVARPGAEGCLPMVFNVLWIALFGWEIALAHLLSAAVTALTVVGIPFAIQHVKLVPLALLPFGRELVPAERERAGA
ncbi:MAG TPA: YccF domain-containing protein [Thermoanaerobaculia bacterium]|nr:YccF domain-containing protein [Thermoanaerobaculia bacterium]